MKHSRLRGSTVCEEMTTQSLFYPLHLRQEHWRFIAFVLADVNLPSRSVDQLRHTEDAMGGGRVRELLTSVFST